MTPPPGRSAGALHAAISLWREIGTETGIMMPAAIRARKRRSKGGAGSCVRHSPRPPAVRGVALGLGGRREEERGGGIVPLMMKHFLMPTS
jgi:hypothetical protein